jgi:signal transduction histidine kinase
VLGAIVFVSAESGRTYSPDDLELARDLASRAALAIDNTLLFREAERRAHEEEALRRATQAVSAAYTVEEVIDRIAGTALDAVDADGAFIERIDLVGDTALVVAAAGHYAPEVGSSVPLERSFAQRVVERGEAELLDSLAEHGARLPGDLADRCAGCSAIVVPLLDGGEAIGALLLLRDLERGSFRDDEIARARTFADLAALALRKVHLLADSEQRRAELETVMVSRARLLRGFSHDVKNPLGAADGYMQLLEDGVLGDLDDEQNRSIGRARRALRSALRLIDDLVELARAEAGQIEINPEPVDLREVAREMTEEYRAQAEAKGLALAAELPAELPLVHTDTARLRQILGNLLSNAIKYTRSGSINVAARLRPGPNTHDCAVIEVADTGPGIAAEQRHLLFQEFTRLDPDSAAGAGLGLAISRRVAHALGGDITFEPRDGAGSTFVVWVPGPGAHR